MIITSIKANNVLKYSELLLEDLPEKGIIAVSGHNESGKSTIGETVCFALFGRTFSLRPDDLVKIINWGEENCSVTVCFKVEDQEYSLYRYLDSSGNHSARLTLQGEDDTPLARSPQQVDAAVANILGYRFEEFIESFYLAQREITTPHPHSTAVKTIAGIGALEQASMAYDEQAISYSEELEELESRKSALQEELLELDYREGQLATLEEEKVQQDADLDATVKLADELKNACDSYIANELYINGAIENRKKAGFRRLLSLLLALLLGGIWGLATYAAEFPLTVALLDKLAAIPGWQDSSIHYFAIAGGVFAVFFLYFWMRSAGFNKRLMVLRASSARLADVMADVHAIEEYELVQHAPATEDELAEDEDSGEGDADDQMAYGQAKAGASRYDVQDYYGLQSEVAAVRADASKVADYAAIELQWLAEQVSIIELSCEHLAKEINQESERGSHHSYLQMETASLASRAEALSEKLGRREKAIELLAGASRHFSSKFNRDIRDLMARTLPVFTQGRYEHLQIEAGLGVKVFSSAKRDFLDIEEISSGTQRQIMLALRLAMAQKLMGRTVKGRQFAFLDEPFAFFDEERTRHALQALDELSDAISQIWIVSQTFPEGHDFAAEIKCSRDLDAMSLGTELAAEE